VSTKDVYHDRQNTIRWVILLAAGILVLKLAQIQLFDHTYQNKAESTTIEKNIIYPSRGLIYDRFNKLLVNNKAIYDLMVTYRQINPAMDTQKFCKLLNIDTATFRKNLTKNWKSGQFSKSIPFEFLTNISSQTYARFQESLFEFPGFFIQLKNVRGYPLKSAAQIYGYIGEVDQKKIDSSRGKYVLGDYIGITGIEKSYEPLLSGKKGVEYILKDNLGRLVGSYKNGALDSQAVSGKDLIVSLDINLQQYGEELMQDKTGSIVAIEPSTGEILAMITTPTFDPNVLSVDNPDRNKEYVKLLTNAYKPMFDRSVMAKYPPGSLFKTIVGLIGLQEGVWSPNNYVFCGGGYWNGKKLQKCHRHVSCGNISEAIEHSCNTYFFNEFRRIIDKFGYNTPQKGLDVFSDYLYNFGLGRPLGIDFPNENKGNVPTSQYFDKVYPKAKGGWRSPGIISIGIGQGEIQLSTIQMANLAAIIANRGYFYTPHLVKTIKGAEAIDPKFTTKRSPKIDARYYEYVIDGMQGVVMSGTGKKAYVPDITICGKTGTVQNPHNHKKDHSVFFAFAPKNNPKIAIAAYVEFGGWGGDYAAPIASLMIEKYLRTYISEGRKAMEKKMKETKLVTYE
jgi:penicillin-binding protein 2